MARGRGVRRRARRCGRWAGSACSAAASAATAIRTLVEAWETIATPEVASLEARGPALLAAGLLEESTANGERRLLPSPWMRRAVGPLSAGAGWERRHLPTVATPIARADVESAFLLAIPLLRLRPECTGTCRLAVELPGPAAESKPVGALVTVERGRIAECTPRLTGQAHCWALGTPKAWLTAVIEGDPSGLRINGDESLAMELVWGLHEVLFVSESQI